MIWNLLQTTLPWLFDMSLDLADIVLIVLLTVAGWVIWRAQGRVDFDFANMLKDDNNKESFLKLAGMGAFAFHTWFVIHEALINNQSADTNQAWIYYGVLWSGSAVAGKLIETWGQRGRQ